MKILLLLSLLPGVAVANEHCKQKTITVAVIDSGFGFNNAGRDAKLCKFGHKYFSTLKMYTEVDYGTISPVPIDTNSHGTNIVGVIDSYAKKSGADYCIVVVKYYSDQQSGIQNLEASIKAINYAANIKADFINYSGGGPEFNEKEYAAVEKFLKTGGRFVSAAGNEKKNIDEDGEEYYPAKYDERIIVVGNLRELGVRSESSNYGDSVTRWEVGENVTAYGLTMSGTSQATAVATGKLVSERQNKCDIGL